MKIGTRNTARPGAALGVASGVALVLAIHAMPVCAQGGCIDTTGAESATGCPVARSIAGADRSLHTSVDVAVLPADPAASRQAVQNLASPTLNPVAAGTQTVQARAWVQSGSIGLGWGADTPIAAAANAGHGRLALDGTRPVLAMRADLAPGARMSFERIGRRLDSSPPSPIFNADSNNANDSSTSRLGLEFKAAKRSAQMPLGTLRFQVSSASTLSLRPRSGGMAMSYRSTF